VRRGDHGGCAGFAGGCGFDQVTANGGTRRGAADTGNGTTNDTNDTNQKIGSSRDSIRGQASNEVSDRQWGDILGVLKVQSGSLDREYLERWARSLNISDLLGRAQQQQLDDVPGSVES